MEGQFNTAGCRRSQQGPAKLAHSVGGHAGARPNSCSICSESFGSVGIGPRLSAALNDAAHSQGDAEAGALDVEIGFAWLPVGATSTSDVNTAPARAVLSLTVEMLIDGGDRATRDSRRSLPGALYGLGLHA